MSADFLVVSVAFTLALTASWDVWNTRRELTRIREAVENLRCPR